MYVEKKAPFSLSNAREFGGSKKAKNHAPIRPPFWPISRKIHTFCHFCHTVRDFHLVHVITIKIRYGSWLLHFPPGHVIPRDLSDFPWRLRKSARVAKRGPNSLVFDRDFRAYIKMVIFAMQNISRGPGRTNHFREAKKYVIFSLPGELTDTTASCERGTGACAMTGP